jgi:hypothetical protein
MAWLRSEKLRGSRKKKTGVLFPTMSHSSVLGVKLESRTADIALRIGCPRSPATVEKHANIGVCFPIFEKIAALVYFMMS